MKKPLNTAAWSAVIGILLGLLSIPISFLAKQSPLWTFVLMIVSLASGLFGILFVYGFIILAKKFNSKLLHVSSWIAIAASGLAILLVTIFQFLSIISLASAQQTSSNEFTATGIFFLLFILVWFVIAAVAGAISILFGVGLLKLQEKVEYAKTAAILEIVAGATYIILIGFIVKIVAYAFEIVLMFKASEKFEKTKS